jgi:hypothetical protein
MSKKIVTDEESPEEKPLVSDQGESYLFEKFILKFINLT